MFSVCPSEAEKPTVTDGMSGLDAISPAHLGFQFARPATVGFSLGCISQAGVGNASHAIDTGMFRVDLQALVVIFDSPLVLLQLHVGIGPIDISAKIIRVKTAQLVYLIPGNGVAIAALSA